MPEEQEKVTDLQTFLKQLPTHREEIKDGYFYRGQADATWELLPAILRNGREEKEHDIYNYIMTECAQEFDGLSSHAEILSKMQHYGVPTRLLDVTNNPLVALYFACEETENDGVVFWMIADDRDGIKSFDRDTISILSCLSRFNNIEKNEISKLINSIRGGGRAQVICTEEEIQGFNSNELIKRLLHEIKKEKPAFEDCIFPDDLIKKFFFIPKKNNARIIRQGGAFVIYGLENIDPSGTKRQQFNGRFGKIVIDKAYKQVIKEELSYINISKATLFPELYKVAEFVKEKYG